MVSNNIKIKNINNIKETEDLNIYFPYYSIILYRILFKPDFYKKFDQDSERALNFIKHIIDITISSSYPGSITFQIESEQFISIINLKKNDDVYYFSRLSIEIVNSFIKTLNGLKINSSH